MKNKISRKKFIKNISIASMGILNFSCYLNLTTKKIKNTTNFKLQNDPNGIINLLKGFNYSIISEKGNKMSDGIKVPDHADGMASFSGNNGRIILIRNHEIGHFRKIEDLLRLNPIYNEHDFIKKNNTKFYDSCSNNKPCGGGTTTIVYNPITKEVENEYLSLAGTLVNCSGGITPWNTWISCEETVDSKGNGLLKNHGYNFEVQPSETTILNQPIPLKAMGRFRHEAIAIDPNNSIAYQTEDRNDGLIYKFIPFDKQNYFKGGNLQAIKFIDKPGLDTRNWDGVKIELNKKYPIEWINLNNVDSMKDDLRYRAYNQGAAIFARPEGMWYSENEIYFTCTSGGKNKLGQIWKYYINEKCLELFFESHNKDTMELCDNLTIAPWGDVIICEDGKGMDRIIGIKQDGSSYIIAENIFNNSEFAGANFSPDGKILFVNIFSPTKTLAITGPWEKLI
tara:strand:- start:44 stop:1402 length:1359 start_codon:yes stop_codon:yes gene_type:complete